ncbi:hypothetical protein ACFX11_037651 [Malus domestica]
MLLRGQGDLPVRICDPCKKLEEAVRFERYGPKGRAGRGSSKLTSNHDDEVLEEISPPPSDLKPQNSRINDKGICTAGGAFSGSISIFPRDLESSSGFPITPTRIIPPELPTTPALPRPATIVTTAAVVASRTLHHHLCSSPLLPSVPSSNGDGKVSDIKAAPLFSCTLLRLLPRSRHQLQRLLSND